MAKLAILGGSPVISEPFPPYRPLGDEEVEAAKEVLNSGVLSGFVGAWGEGFLGGPQVQMFEQEWSEYFDVPHSVTVNSATSGLIAAVGAVGVGVGDEVIVSPYTMSASASCVRVWGGTPVFADIDPRTFCLDPAAVEAAVTDRTRAIIVVDLMGQAADLKEIMVIARNHDLAVIEDAAQSPGAMYGGRRVGTIGDIGVFSLNYHKTIHTGEGGVCCTGRDDLADRLRLIRNHGEAVVQEMGLKDRPQEILGFNFRLGEVEAAIGRVQLQKLRGLTRTRRDLAALYDACLAELEGIYPPVVGHNRDHVYYTYTMRLVEKEAGVSRKRVAAALTAEGCPCVEGYVRPLYLQPLYTADWPGKGNRTYNPGSCPVAERMFGREVIYHAYLYHPIEDGLGERICETFTKVWRNRDALRTVRLPSGR